MCDYGIKGPFLSLLTSATHMKTSRHFHISALTLMTSDLYALWQERANTFKKKKEFLEFASIHALSHKDQSLYGFSSK